MQSLGVSSPLCCHITYSINSGSQINTTKYGVILQMYYTYDGSTLTHIMVKDIYYEGTAVAQWLRFRATNRKVAGSIPDGVMGFFR
jgi:hypothetical protein